MKACTGPISSNQIFYVESFQSGVPMDKETLFHNLALAFLLEANNDPHMQVDPYGFQINLGVQYSSNALTMTKAAALAWITTVLGKNPSVASTTPALANPAPVPTTPVAIQTPSSLWGPIKFTVGNPPVPVATLPAPVDPTASPTGDKYNAVCGKCGASGFLLFNSIDCSRGCK